VKEEASQNKKIQVPTYVTKASKKWCLFIFILKYTNGWRI
jgi:hypothetical protein